MSIKQNSKSKDINRTLQTPETAKRSERKSSESIKKFSDNLNKKDLDGEDNGADIEHDVQNRPISRENRAVKKFSHSVYNKAAMMLDRLIEEEGSIPTESLDFGSEFERRRAFSLAFAAKRYEAILKDVLLDSSFYSSYFKLETFHHTKVLVMLLDFYEHNFRFSESARKKVEVDSSNHLDYIHEIQAAFFHHKIKLCSAFARNRIKACALSLDAMLPTEVKERGECGSRHFLCAWINPFMTNRKDVLDKLKEDDYKMQENLSEDSYEDNNEYVFSLDPKFEDLLVFPTSTKDDVYNSDLVATYSLIPQSRPRYLMAEIARRVVDEGDQRKLSSTELISGSKVHESLVAGCDIVLTHPETGSLAAHLCSFIRNNRLYICGCRDTKKIEVDKHLKQMGVTNYELISDEFSVISSNDPRFRSAKLIFCNPPCSKSRVVNPVDFILQEGSEAALSLSEVVTKAQVRGYVEEQEATLRNALSFALVNAVVYATFSMHSKENESLVERILQDQSDIKNMFQFEDLNGKIEVIGENEDSRFISIAPTNEMDGFFATLLTRKIKGDSVRDIMDRAAKKGLVKKSSSKSYKKSKTSVSVKSSSNQQQPPHVAARMSKSMKGLSLKPANKSGKSIAAVAMKRSDDDDDVTKITDKEKAGRFKF